MKVKDALMRQQEMMFEMELSYREWLRDNFTEPSEEEINDMERDFYKSLTAGNKIISCRPLNNENYNPIIGA